MGIIPQPPKYVHGVTVLVQCTLSEDSCTKFRENILDGFKVIIDIQSVKHKRSKLIKNEDRVSDLVLCTFYDDA